MPRPKLTDNARAQLLSKGLTGEVLDELPDSSVIHYNSIYKEQRGSFDQRNPRPIEPVVPTTVPERLQFTGTQTAEDAFIAAEFGISPERGQRAQQAAEDFTAVQRTPGGTAAPILSRLQQPFSGTQFAQDVTGTARGEIPAEGLSGLLGALAPQTMQTRQQMDEAYRQGLNANKAALMQMRLLYPDLTDEERVASTVYDRLSRDILTGKRPATGLAALQAPELVPTTNRRLITQEAARISQELMRPKESPLGGIIEPPAAYAGRILSAPVSGAVGVGEAILTSTPTELPSALTRTIPERIQAGESVTGAGRDIGAAAARATGIEAFEPIGTGLGFVSEFIVNPIPGSGVARAVTRTGTAATRAAIAGGVRAGADVAATQVIGRVSPTYALRRAEASPQIAEAIEQAGNMARAYRGVEYPELSAAISRRLTAAGVANADDTAAELVSRVREIGGTPTAAQTKTIARQLAQRATRPGAETVRITPTTAAPEDIAAVIMQEYRYGTNAGRLATTIQENPQKYISEHRGRPIIDVRRAAEDAGLTEPELIDILQSAARRRYDIAEADLITPAAEPARLATMFSGMGTVEAGLTAGTARSVDAVEYMPDIMEQFNRVNGTAYVPRSVIDIDVADVAAADPEVFHASPVCKNFTPAKRGIDNANELDRLSAEKVAEVIREVRPPIVTVENVPAYKGTAMFELITDQLTASGYNWNTHIVEAAEYGAAQERRRLILRAVRKDIGKVPPAPEKTGGADWYATLEDLIADAPDYKPGRSRKPAPEPTPPPVFRKSDYDLTDVTAKEASEFLERNHYAGGAGRQGKYIIGLRNKDGELKGVAWWNPPGGGANVKRWAARQFIDAQGNPIHPDEVINLSRLAISPDVPRNAASYLLQRSIKRIRANSQQRRKAGQRPYRVALTYADQREGHTGFIYKLTGWTYTGESAKHSKWIDPATGRQVSTQATKNRNNAQMYAAGYKKQAGMRKHRYVLPIDRGLKYTGKETPPPAETPRAAPAAPAAASPPAAPAFKDSDKKLADRLLDLLYGAIASNDDELIKQGTELYNTIKSDEINKALLIEELSRSVERAKEGTKTVQELNAELKAYSEGRISSYDFYKARSNRQTLFNKANRSTDTSSIANNLIDGLEDTNQLTLILPVGANDTLSATIIPSADIINKVYDELSRFKTAYDELINEINNFHKNHPGNVQLQRPTPQDDISTVNNWLKNNKPTPAAPAAPTAPPVPPILRNAPDEERRRFMAMAKRGTIDLNKPILSTGGSTSSTNILARNAGQPAPTIKSTPKELPKIYLPDGTAKRVTPRMMARLMGLSDSVPVPDTGSIATQTRAAKTMLGNGIEGNVTRKWIEPLYSVLQGSKEAPSRQARDLIEASVKRDLEGMSLPRYNAAAVSALDSYALANGAEDLTAIQAADPTAGQRLRRALTPRELRPGKVRTLINRATADQDETMTPGLEKLINATGRELGTMGDDLLRATRARERAAGISRPEAFIIEVVSEGYGGNSRRATREAMYGLYGAFDSVGQAIYGSRASAFVDARPEMLREDIGQIMNALADYAGDDDLLIELRDLLSKMGTSAEAYGLGALQLPRILAGVSVKDLATRLNLSDTARMSSKAPLFTEAAGLDLIGLTYSQARTGRILSEALTPSKLRAAGISYNPQAPGMLLNDTAAAMGGTAQDAATIYNAVLAEMAGTSAVRLNLLDVDTASRIRTQLASTEEGRAILQRYDDAELTELLLSAGHRLAPFQTAARPGFEDLKIFIQQTLADRIQPIAQLEAAGVSDAEQKIKRLLNLEGVSEMLKRVNKPEEQRLLKLTGELIDIYDLAIAGDVAGLAGKANLRTPGRILKSATQAGFYGGLSLLDANSPMSRWVKGGLLAGRFLPNLVYMGMNVLTAPAIVFSTIGPGAAARTAARMAAAPATTAIAGAAGLEAANRLTRLSPTIASLNAFYGYGDPLRVILTTPAGEVYRAADIAELIPRITTQAQAELAESLASDFRTYSGIAERAVMRGQPTERISELQQSRGRRAFRAYTGLDPATGEVGQNIFNEMADAQDLTFRVGVMIDALQAGRPVDEALTLAQDALFDYGRMTDWERQTIAKRIWFWTFRRENLRAAALNLVENPERMRAAYQGTGILQGYDDNPSPVAADYMQVRPFIKLFEDTELQRRFATYGPSAPMMDALAEMIDYATAGAMLIDGTLYALFDTEAIPGQLRTATTASGRASEVATRLTTGLAEFAVEERINPFISGAMELGMGIQGNAEGDALTDYLDPRFLAYMDLNPDSAEIFKMAIDIEPIPYANEIPGNGHYAGRQWRVKANPSNLARWSMIRHAMILGGFERTIRDYAPIYHRMTREEGAAPAPMQLEPQISESLPPALDLFFRSIGVASPVKVLTREERRRRNMADMSRELRAAGRTERATPAEPMKSME